MQQIVFEKGEVIAKSVLEGTILDIRSSDMRDYVEHTTGITFAPVFRENFELSNYLQNRYSLTQKKVSKYDLPIKPLWYAPVFDEQRLYTTGEDNDWVFMPLARDASYTSGNFSLPIQVAHTLEKIVRSDVQFDSIFVAHEIHKGSVLRGQLVPLELILPPLNNKNIRLAHKIEDVASLLVNNTTDITLALAKGVIDLVLSTSRSSIQLAKAFTDALNTSVTTHQIRVSQSTSNYYDPILFGLQLDIDREIDKNPMALWYYLSSWNWKDWE